MVVVWAVGISTLSSIFLFINITFICDMVWHCKRKIKISGFNALAVLLFLASSVLLPLSYQYKSLSSFAILSMPVFYIMLFAVINVFIKTKMMRIIYVFLLYIFTDSLFGSSLIAICDVVGFKVSNIEYIGYMASLLFNICCLVMLYLCRKRIIFRNFQSSVELMPTSIYVLILIIFFFTGLLLSLQNVRTDFYETKQVLSQLLFLLIIPAFLIIIVFLLINSISRRYHENISSVLESQVRRQIKHYDEAERLNSDLRAFKHDYDNHISCLKFAIETQGSEAALEYINNLNYAYKETQKKFDTGNYIADALFNEKNSICEKAGISFEHTGVIPATCINDVDLCILLFNLLDNAIEACKRIENGERIIRASTNYKNDLFNIKISNTVNEPVKIYNNYIASTKDNKSNHGFGLMNIHRIVNKYDGKIKMDCEDGFFTSNIILCASSGENKQSKVNPAL